MSQLNNNQSLQEAMLQAMKAISSKEINNSKGTLTIEAKIVEIIDEGSGIYKVEYLGSQFEATSMFSEFEYSIDDLIYVLIPDGNFDKNKIILSPISTSTATYAVTEGGNSYINLGDSLFEDIDIIKLCTFHSESKVINVNSNNFVKLFNSALLDSRVFTLTCRIQTNIDLSRRAKGNYGLRLTIPTIQDNIQRTFSVVLDISNITGNPYGLTTDALQIVHFTLPEDMILDVDRASSASYPFLTAFVNNFPAGDAASDYYDIFINDVQLLSTLVVSEFTMSGYYLSLVAEGGNSFLATADQVDTKKIIPTIYLNGKVTNIKNFQCYQFVENCLVDTSNSKFNRFGGLGQEILNTKTNMEIDEIGKETYQYNTAIYEQTVKQNDIRCATRYKCVCVKGDKEFSQIITIRNLAADVNFKLESATGSNIYIQNVGTVKLLASYYENGLTNISDSNTLVSYDQLRLDKNGNYIDNDFYNVLKINDKVEINGKIYYQTEIEFDTNLIDESNTIRCTVSLTTPQIDGTSRTVTAGTETILISTGAVPTYRINIANSDKIYKYDSNGNSPKVADYDGPTSSIITSINPLSITLFKPDGTEFSDDEYKVTNVTQKVPVESMITIDNNIDKGLATGGYYYISGTYAQRSILPYGIANTYNKKKEDNTIYVYAYFKGNNAEDAQASAEGVINLQFLKDGESGTNGSKYSAIIVAKDGANEFAYGERNSKGIVNKIQLIYAADRRIWYRYNPADPAKRIYALNPGAPVYDFGIKLYADGERLNSTSIVSQSIFDNDYTYNNIVSPVTISNGQLTMSNNNSYYQTDTSSIYCATIQALVHAQRSATTDQSITNSEEYIYAYYPIECTYVANLSYVSDDSLQNLKMIPSLDGGYDQVVYSSDGTNPSYNNNKKFIISDSLYNNDEGDYYDYNWSTSDNLNIQGNSTIGREGNVLPATKFDNGAAKNYVRVGLVRSISQLNQLINKRDSISSDIDADQAKVNYYTNLQNALWDESVNFFTKYNYNSYVENLSNLKDLFLLKTNLYSTVDNMLDTLNNIQSSCNSLSKKYGGKSDSKTQELLAYLRNIDNRCDNLININNDLSKTINLISGIKEDGTSYKATLIINTNNNQKPDNLVLPTNYPTKYNIQTITNLIKKYNQLIKNIYSNYLTELNNNINKYTEDEISAVNIIKDIYDFLNNITQNTLITAGDEFYKFIALRDYIQNKLNKVTTSEGYSLDLLLDNVINPIQYELKDYYTLDYTEKINNYQKEIENKQIIVNDYNKSINQGVLSTAQIIHIKPVIMLYNRYEMSNINGQDGNKTQVEDGYILAPQMGAGKKENGLFTGIIMGVRQIGVKTSNKQKIGLFGYHDGVQSLFLNAKDGSALFGKSGDSQIIIDPNIKNGSNGKTMGLLYNSGYFPSTAYGDDGKPTNYLNIGTTKLGGEGMLINLTAPYIHFADIKGKIYSGDHATLGSTTDGFYISNDGLSIGKSFTVLSTGVSTVIGDGSNLGQQRLVGEDDEQKLASKDNGILLDSPNSRIILGNGISGEIYSGYHTTLNSTEKGFYISNNGLSIQNSFKVSIGDQGDGKLEVGKINSTKHQTIYSGGTNQNEYSYIAYNTSESKMTTNGNTVTISGAGNNQVYIGTNGIRLGTKFAVDDNGNAVANYITAKGGKIGDWTLDGGKLVGENSGGQIVLDAKGAISGGSSGGNNQSIDRGGTAKFNNVTITGGSITIGSGGAATINSNGDAKFNNITCNNIFSFGSGNNTQSNTSGFNFGSGFLGGNTVNGAFGFTNGTMGLGNAVKNGNGISYDGSKVTIAGDIYANNGYFKGEIIASSGSIGGQTINTNGLYSGSSYLYTYGLSTPSIDTTKANIGSELYIGGRKCDVEKYEGYNTTISKLENDIDSIKGTKQGTISGRTATKTISGTCSVDGKTGTCSINISSLDVTGSCSITI